MKNRWWPHSNSRRPAPNPNGSIQKGDWILLTFPHTSPPSEVALSHSYKSSKSQSQPQNVAGTDMGICAEAEIQAIHSFPEFHIEVKIMGGQVDETRICFIFKPLKPIGCVIWAFPLAPLERQNDTVTQCVLG